MSAYLGFYLRFLHTYSSDPPHLYAHPKGFDWFKTTATSINAMLAVHSAEDFAVKEDLLSYVTILPEKVNKNKERRIITKNTELSFTVTCR